MKRVQQSKIESAIEQVLNTASGFVLAWSCWRFVVVPLIDQGVLSYQDTTIITIIFTVISLIRGYFWRRFFNRNLPHRIYDFFKTMFALRW